MAASSAAVREPPAWAVPLLRAADELLGPAEAPAAAAAAAVAGRGVGRSCAAEAGAAAAAPAADADADADADAGEEPWVAVLRENDARMHASVRGLETCVARWLELRRGALASGKEAGAAGVGTAAFAVAAP